MRLQYKTGTCGRIAVPSRLCWLALAAGPLALLSARPAFAIVFLTQAAETAGTGADQPFLDSEAELIINLNNGVQQGCSGSLVDGGAYVLTAAHCVTGDTDSASATSISIDFTNVGLSLTTASYVVDPVWNGSLTNGGDLALIELGTPITTLTSYEIDTASSASGHEVMLVGYGDNGYGGTGYSPYTFGTLYYGLNVYLGTYSNIPSVYAFQFVSSGRDYVGAEEAMIAPGDSGGGEFIDVGGMLELAGVNDFIGCSGSGTSCSFNSSLGEIGGGTSLFADQAWLDSVLAPEPSAVALLGAALLGIGIVRRRAARATA